MTDKLFSDCCYGTSQQHLQNEKCPQDDHSARARLVLADVLESAGYSEDAEHLRKPIRIGDVIVSHPIAIAAMLVFSGDGR